MVAGAFPQCEQTFMAGGVSYDASVAPRLGKKSSKEGESGGVVVRRKRQGPAALHRGPDHGDGENLFESNGVLVIDITTGLGGSGAPESGSELPHSIKGCQNRVLLIVWGSLPN